MQLLQKYNKEALSKSLNVCRVTLLQPKDNFTVHVSRKINSGGNVHYFRSSETCANLVNREYLFNKLKGVRGLAIFCLNMNAGLYFEK
jgi:hypothetical protein